MSVSSSSSLELLSSSSSESRSPVSPRFSWFHQPSPCDVEFSPNASFSPHGLVIFDTTGCLDQKPGLGHETGSFLEDVEREKRGAIDMNLDEIYPGSYKVIRSRPIRSYRAFHADQTYSHLALQTTHSWNSEDSSFELPQPTSPTRPRIFRLKRTLLITFHSCFRLGRSFRSGPAIYLFLYFGFNLGLTLYNKSLLVHFPFPYTISATHALCGSIGSTVLIRAGSSPPPRLNLRESLILLAFSVLYTVNIIISNLSLGLVTVPFHQVVRASTPLFTILFSSIIFGARSSRPKLIALVPVVAGVGFATYGDYYFTPWGFFLTLLGTTLAALKTIYTNVLQAPSHLRFSASKPDPRVDSSSFPSTKVSPASKSPPMTFRQPYLQYLTPLHLLYLLSPLAFVQTMLIAHFSGELARVWEYSIAGLRYSAAGAIFFGRPSTQLGLSTAQLGLLLLNGVMAFGLNVASFTANKKVGPLSMTVAANVKQVLTILCAVALFNLTVTPTNAVGIVLTLIGGAIYTAVELKEKRDSETMPMALQVAS